MMTDIEFDCFVEEHFWEWVADKAFRDEIDALYTDLGGET